MDEQARQRALIGDWKPQDRVLWDLGVEYHTSCEVHDRTVCLARNEDGIAMPSSSEESRLIGQNARKVRQWAVQRGVELGYTAEQVIRAIQETAGVRIP